MTVIIIDHFLIEVKDQYDKYQVLSEIELNVMNSLWLDQLQSELKLWWKDNLSATNYEIQAEAMRIQEDMRLTTPELPDPIAAEAITISKERIMTKLLAENINLEPSNLTLHATELARREDIRTLAKVRVQARLRAGREMLQ